MFTSKHGLPMGKLLTHVLFLIFIAAAGAQAGSYYIAHRTVVPGASAFTYLDPLLNEHGEYMGYVACQPQDSQVVVRDAQGYALESIPLSGSPIRSTHWRDDGSDTLHLYVLCQVQTSFDVGADFRIFHLTIPQRLSRDSADFRVTPTYTERVIASQLHFSDLDLVTYGQYERSVRVEAAVDFVYAWVYPGRTNGNVSSRSRIFSPDLQEVLFAGDAAPVRQDMTITGRSGAQCSVQLRGYLERESFVTDFQNWNWRSMTVRVADDFGAVAEQSTSYGELWGLFVDDLIPWEPGSELLLAGYFSDLTNTRSLAANQIAAYTMENGVARELWYTEVAPWDAVHIYKPQHQIVGLTSGKSRMVMVDYWSGQPSDSVDLDRYLDRARFFDTRSAIALNLIGASGDTVFVYRFDTPTDVGNIHGPTEEQLPSTLTLHPNYPNPFNGVTQISFSTSIGQYVKLSVFNVLGQEISILFEQYTAAGDYQASWNGKDMAGREQASGIYFAQLRAGADSKMIKLIFLK